jgi:hypothetical protein
MNTKKCMKKIKKKPVSLFFVRKEKEKRGQDIRIP